MRTKYISSFYTAKDALQTNLFTSAAATSTSPNTHFGCSVDKKKNVTRCMSKNELNSFKMWFWISY